MKEITVTAKTVEEAVIQAAIELETTSDNIEYSVIEKGSTGFLGFGAKPAIIRAKKKASLSDAAVVFLKDVFGAMDMNVDISATYNEEEKEINVNLAGEDMGVLIGKRGQTLDSLQYLVSLVVNKEGSDYTRIKLDTEDYRARRKETLETLAKNIAYKVKRTRRSVSLEPMNPYERRIIHSVLQNDKYVVTRSEGEDPYRHVIISLKKEAGGGRRDRADRADRAEKQGRSDRGDRFDRTDRAERYDRSDRADRPDRSDRSDRYERSERGNRRRSDKNDRGGRYQDRRQRNEYVHGTYEEEAAGRISDVREDFEGGFAEEPVFSEAAAISPETMRAIEAASDEPVKAPEKAARAAEAAVKEAAGEALAAAGTAAEAPAEEAKPVVKATIKPFGKGSKKGVKQEKTLESVMKYDNVIK
ncbi:MAG: KH domain-containing protein [Lachnospiraceae bacterium]|nr:KH domain-containing protein [Lachnospiraceae bacterium]